LTGLGNAKERMRALDEKIIEELEFIPVDPNLNNDELNDILAREGALR